MLLDNELLLIISNEHAPTFIINTHHSAAAQFASEFALTHEERVRGGRYTIEYNANKLRKYVIQITEISV